VQAGLELKAKWMECVRPGRTFRETYYFKHHGKTYRVSGLALPVGMGGELIGYEGQVRVL
jgi:hypothetical protein